MSEATRAGPLDQSDCRLLVIGAPKFGNRGNNIINHRVGDLSTSRRRREFDEIAQSLAAFRPTKIAARWPANDQETLNHRYSEYRDGKVELANTDAEQICFRLGAILDFAQIDAVDWSFSPPGNPTDYDFQAWAMANGCGEALNGLIETQQAEADELSDMMERMPISQWLREMNTAEFSSKNQRAYYRIARFGGKVINPGAAWVGTWYARNLRILNNLSLLVERADERILTVYGAGNAAEIRRMAAESGIFAVEDPLSYLPAMAGTKER